MPAVASLPSLVSFVFQNKPAQNKGHSSKLQLITQLLNTTTLLLLVRQRGLCLSRNPVLVPTRPQQPLKKGLANTQACLLLSLGGPRNASDPSDQSGSRSTSDPRDPSQSQAPRLSRQESLHPEKDLGIQTLSASRKGLGMQVLSGSTVSFQLMFPQAQVTKHQPRFPTTARNACLHAKLDNGNAELEQREIC